MEFIRLMVLELLGEKLGIGITFNLYILILLVALVGPRIYYCREQTIYLRLWRTYKMYLIAWRLRYTRRRRSGIVKTNRKKKYRNFRLQHIKYTRRSVEMRRKHRKHRKFRKQLLRRISRIVCYVMKGLPNPLHALTTVYKSYREQSPSSGTFSTNSTTPNAIIQSTSSVITNCTSSASSTTSSSTTSSSVILSSTTPR
jgi:hypothetical protein